jgi:hypothetical protein
MSEQDMVMAPRELLESQLAFLEGLRPMFVDRPQDSSAWVQQQLDIRQLLGDVREGPPAAAGMQNFDLSTGAFWSCILGGETSVWEKRFEDPRHARPDLCKVEPEQIGPLKRYQWGEEVCYDRAEPFAIEGMIESEYGEYVLAKDAAAREAALLELLRDAKRSHGVQHLSYPPRDPWLENRIDERITAVLASGEAI